MRNTYGKNVREFGAVGDGQTDDAPSLQAALDSGETRLVVPSGKYLLGHGLRIGSNTHLVAHSHAILRLADGVGDDQDDFLLTNRDHLRGNHTIRIEGGVWDGNNPGNPRGPDSPNSYTGVMINFTNVDGLTFRSATLLDSESYFVRLGKVSNFFVEDISFEIKNLRPNQDGIHVSGFCNDGIIRRLRGIGSRTPNDDMVALLADDALHRAQNLNGAFNGPISRIRIENLRASSCHSFIRLLSVDHPIDQIEISDVEGGCVCSAINMDACRDCRVKLFDDADRPGGVGSITNVRASDLIIHKAADSSHQPLIDFRTRTDNFRIERFERNMEFDCSPSSPTMHIEKSGNLSITVDGCTQSHAVEGDQSFEMPNGNRSIRLARDLGPDDEFTLSNGGFVSLNASSS